MQRSCSRSLSRSWARSQLQTTTTFTNVLQTVRVKRIVREKKEVCDTSSVLKSQFNSKKINFARGGGGIKVAEKCQNFHAKKKKQVYQIIEESGICVLDMARTPKKQVTWRFGLNLRCISFCQKIHFGFFSPHGTKKPSKFTYLPQSLYVKKNNFSTCHPGKKKQATLVLIMLK